MPSSLYQQTVLEHGRSPRNVGLLEHPTHHASASNPLCGDELRIELEVHGGIVTSARCQPRGCLLSVAAASLLVERSIGRPAGEVLSLCARLERLFEGTTAGAHTAGEASDRRPEDHGLEALLAVRDHPLRSGCVRLAPTALHRALSTGRA